MKTLLAFFYLLAAAYATPVHLRCEYLENPLGMDAPAPQLSWQSDSTERSWQQSAYQVLVASSAENLKNASADVWDSGKQNSSESVGILYAGPKLESRKRYFWLVKTWDTSGQVSTSDPAWWETGMFDKSDWKSKWITAKNPEAETDWNSIQWVWVRGKD